MDERTRQALGAHMASVRAPAFDLTNAAQRLDPLSGTAFPVAQDRWERLVTFVTIPDQVDRVWEALVTPSHVAEWLGVCQGDWAARGRESTLDFEDGEYFYCFTERCTAPNSGREGKLTHLWRWVGIGPATRVTWTVAPSPEGTSMMVVEEATNPPSDWRSWNGMGWPGILDQLARYLRTGTNTRWPWRRMGPYLQIPLPEMPFQAWETLTSPGAVKHWLQRTAGSLEVDDEMTVTMGDASGTARLNVTKSVDAGQEFPSYLPYLEFRLRRPSWTASLGGRMWIEPIGLGGSLLQIFHHDWEHLDIADPVAERKILTGFWVNAAARAQMLLQPASAPMGPHGWSLNAGPGGPVDGGQSAPYADFGAAVEFTRRAMDDLSGATTTLLVVIGVRLGLFERLAAGPATGPELAARTGLSERYLREWMWGLASSGYLAVDVDEQRFALPPAHAAVLTDGGSPLSLAAGYELIPPMASMLDDVVRAFETGQGIGAENYPSSLATAMEKMSATWFDSMLTDQWLPAIDGVVDRLARGGRVADIGSGGGQAIIALAQRFPDAEFAGYDLHLPNVERASSAAEAANIADRVTFHHADATTAFNGEFDLVTMFDVLHDAPDPEALLRSVRRALAPDSGALLVLESNSADRPEDNEGPASSILYATSVLYCVPTALADGGPALGTLGLPHTKLAVLARQAGFSSVRPLPIQSPMNALYVLRP